MPDPERRDAMNGVNFQASFHNLTQVDKIQQDEHHAPVAKQDQNAEEAKEEAAKRIDMPTEPDETEGKVIDPENKKKNPGQRRRKKKKKKKAKRAPDRRRDRGRFVDFSA